jgi:hypothetical protein
LYSNSVYCDSLPYVLENRSSGQVVVCVDVPRDRLPEEIYEDKLYWAIWKKAQGYKLYLVPPLRQFGQRVLENLEEPIPDGVVRLYRVMRPKENN